MRRTPPRGGYTLLELIAVLAIILILGAVALPSLFAVYGNVRQKAGADMVRARLADARAWAMESDRPYRVQVSEDGLRIRVSAESPLSVQPTDDGNTPPDRSREDEFDKVTASVELDDEMPAATDGDGWVTAATFLPNGTCREDTAVIAVAEDGFPPLRIRVRGVTGSVRVLPYTPEANLP